MEESDQEAEEAPRQLEMEMPRQLEDLPLVVDKEYLDGSVKDPTCSRRGSSLRWMRLNIKLLTYTVVLDGFKHWQTRCLCRGRLS